MTMNQTFRDTIFTIYRETRPLTNLVYIDGISAGKTIIGTLDIQDYILRNMTDSDSG
jgi:hypothetical protein